MLPVLEMLDNAGYHSLRSGGATFDVCMRYLEEDPWERLRLIRQRVRQTSLQQVVERTVSCGLSALSPMM